MYAGSGYSYSSCRLRERGRPSSGDATGGADEDVSTPVENLSPENDNAGSNCVANERETTIVVSISNATHFSIDLPSMEH